MLFNPQKQKYEPLKGTHVPPFSHGSSAHARLPEWKRCRCKFEVFSVEELWDADNSLAAGRNGGSFIGTLVSHRMPVNDVLQRQTNEPATGMHTPLFMHGLRSQPMLLSYVTKTNGVVIDVGMTPKTHYFVRGLRQPWSAWIEVHILHLTMATRIDTCRSRSCQSTCHREGTDSKCRHL